MLYSVLSLTGTPGKPWATFAPKDTATSEFPRPPHSAFTELQCYALPGPPHVFTAKTAAAVTVPFTGRRRRGRFIPARDLEAVIAAETPERAQVEPEAIQYGAAIELLAAAAAGCDTGLASGRRSVSTCTAGMDSEAGAVLGVLYESVIEVCGDTWCAQQGGGGDTIFALVEASTGQGGMIRKQALTDAEVLAVLKQLH